ncbi:MAG TPA: DUF4158 domain-containing protein [Ktedonobacteraceae bacterium]|nr:DUF4158 domain-containing protein [Ktedonobacteraceae bacterium]
MAPPNVGSEISLDNVLTDRDMKRQWDIEELIEHFTLIEEDKDVLENKTGATLLGCALLLKCFEYEGHFPSAKYEIPKSIVDYIARQLKVDANLFPQYDWNGRTIKLHRTQIREHLHFREATAEDSEQMTSWLIATHLSTDQNPDHLKEKVLARFREEQIEPPTADRIDRLIRSACVTYEHILFQTIFQRLSPETQAQIDQLLERSEQREAETEVEEEGERSPHSATHREVISFRDRAFAELGRAIKTIFLCQYLQSEELHRERHEGLNVIENPKPPAYCHLFGSLLSLSNPVGAGYTQDSKRSVVPFVFALRRV